jgi:ubiquinone/menaquinone biosynthesis C-methylase UbiE
MHEGVESKTYLQWLSQAAPDVQLHHLMSGYWISAALGVAAELNLEDLMANGSRASTDLARMTGTNPSALYRLLRTLASVGLFTEVEPEHFALTEMGDLLRTDHPKSLHGLTRYNCGETQWRRFGALRQSINTGQSVDLQVFGVRMRTYWAEHPEARAIFDVAMRSIAVQVLDAVVSAYDFSPFHTVVDVGGGYGALLSAILTRTPGLRGVLFDRPEVVEGAKSSLASAGVLDRCEVVGGDMFVEIPRGGDAYVCSRVIHDWDDERATVALRNCRRVLAPSGALLVVEEVIPPGDAPSYGKLSDLNMLVGPGGQERTEAEYRALYTAAGFTLTRVMPTQSRMSIIVGIPRDARQA